MQEQERTREERQHSSQETPICSNELLAEMRGQIAKSREDRQQADREDSDDASLENPS
jgi:hypothetical protein